MFLYCKISFQGQLIQFLFGLSYPFALSLNHFAECRYSIFPVLVNHSFVHVFKILIGFYGCKDTTIIRKFQIICDIFYSRTFFTWLLCRIIDVLFLLETLCLSAFLKGGMSHLLAKRDFPLALQLIIRNFVPSRQTI